MDETNLLSHVNKQLEEKAHNGDDVDVEAVLSIYSFLTHDKPKLMEAALEVLDKQDNHRIIEVISQSTGRSFHLIQGSQCRKYLVLSNYCPCQSFSQLFHKSSNITNGRNISISATSSPPPLCKHMFAVALATSLGRLDVQHVTDANFMEIFKSVEAMHI
jgi:predicted nucleic acid-binding Zn finger protein